MVVKRLARSALLVRLKHAHRRRSMLNAARRAQTTSNAEIFQTIYAERLWGSAEDGGISSGVGSFDAHLVAPYVAAVRAFLDGFDASPDVVDLGCGDFRVGRRIRPYCGAYVACDVADIVIQRHRQDDSVADVDFRQLDMCNDELPDGEVVFIRQVLQHLSNEAISSVAAKLGKYRFAVVTEHVPSGPFTPNADMPTGFHNRSEAGSGVDLAAPPFSLRAHESYILCSVPYAGSDIRTTVYRLG